MCNQLRILLLPFFCIFAVPAVGQPPLTEDGDGMTCQFHFRAARADWRRPGGDWLDADGRLHGGSPFSEADIASSPQTRVLAFDMASLVQEWSEGHWLTGAIMLRQMPGGRGPGARLYSGESDAEGTQPFLELNFADGSRRRIEPAADTTLDCNTIKSLGDEATLKVGGKISAALVFPLEELALREVESATLHLTVDKVYQGASRLGVFQLAPPWMSDRKAHQGIAAVYPGDKFPSGDPRVLFTADFERGPWHRGWTTVNELSVAERIARESHDGFQPLSGNALRVTLAKGNNLALDLRYDFAKAGLPEPEEAYLRYYLRFGKDWKPTRDGGKLPGFAGTYNRAGWGLRKSDGYNGWSARGAFFRLSAKRVLEEHVAIGSYLYHPEIRGSNSENQGWGLGPAGWLGTNRWYSVEQYVRLNTPGRADGELKAWVDGRLVLDREGMEFRKTSELKIENAWFNVYHGGVAPAPAEMTLYIDNVVISREYIGPMVIP